MLILRFSLLALIAAAPMGCAVLQQVVKQPRVQVRSVSFQSQGLREGQLNSQVELYNPNGFGLPLQSLSYRLSINGHQLAQGTLSFDKKIPAHGSLALSLPVHFQYQQVLNGLSSILQQQQAKYELSGEVKMALMQIPFRQSGQLDLRF